jgi:hypothetical protein
MQPGVGPLRRVQRVEVGTQIYPMLRNVVLASEG